MTKNKKFLRLLVSIRLLYSKTLRKIFVVLTYHESQKLFVDKLKLKFKHRELMYILNQNFYT